MKPWWKDRVIWILLTAFVCLLIGTAGSIVHQVREGARHAEELPCVDLVLPAWNGGSCGTARALEAVPGANYAICRCPPAPALEVEQIPMGAP